MALDRFNDDLNVVGNLGDDPKRDDGLSTPQFKSCFDKAGLAIQRFINNKLIPQIESAIDEGALLQQITSVLNRKLDKAGGIMTGDIDMNGQKLRGLNTPTKDDEAATKGFVSSEIKTKVDKSSVVNNFTTTEEGFVADARALKTLNDSKQSMELIWENDSPVSEFGGRKIAMTLNEGEVVEIVFSDSPNARGIVGSVIIANITTCGSAGGSIKYNSIREISIDTDGITFKDGLNQTQSGATVQATKTANNVLRPLKIYRIKEVS